MEIENYDLITNVYSQPVETASRLKTLGLTIDVLRRAVRFGLGYAIECTENDPPAVKGIIAWGKINRALRELLIPQGWEPDNGQNYARTIHPDGKWGIAVAAGNYNTGNPDRMPATSVEKGPMTKQIVAVNQLSFSEIALGWDHLSSEVRTWILLHYRIDSPDAVRAELSLPQGLDKNGRITVWRERIIFAVFDEPTLDADQSPEDPKLSDPVDVPVRPKGTRLDNSKGIQSA